MLDDGGAALVLPCRIALPTNAKGRIWTHPHAGGCDSHKCGFIPFALAFLEGNTAYRPGKTERRCLRTRGCAQSSAISTRRRPAAPEMQSGAAGHRRGIITGRLDVRLRHHPSGDRDPCHRAHPSRTANRTRSHPLGQRPGSRFRQPVPSVCLASPACLEHRLAHCPRVFHRCRRCRRYWHHELSAGTASLVATALVQEQR